MLDLLFRKMIIAPLRYESEANKSRSMNVRTYTHVQVHLASAVELRDWGLWGWR